MSQRHSVTPARFVLPHIHAHEHRIIILATAQTEPNLCNRVFRVLLAAPLVRGVVGENKWKIAVVENKTNSELVYPGFRFAIFRCCVCPRSVLLIPFWLACFSGGGSKCEKKWLSPVTAEFEGLSSIIATGEAKRIIADHWFRVHLAFRGPNFVYFLQRLWFEPWWTHIVQFCP